LRSSSLNNRLDGGFGSFLSIQSENAFRLCFAQSSSNNNVLAFFAKQLDFNKSSFLALRNKKNCLISPMVEY